MSQVLSALWCIILCHIEAAVAWWFDQWSIDNSFTHIAPVHSALLTGTRNLSGNWLSRTHMKFAVLCRLSWILTMWYVLYLLSHTCSQTTLSLWTYRYLGVTQWCVLSWNGMQYLMCVEWNGVSNVCGAEMEWSI